MPPLGQELPVLTVATPVVDLPGTVSPAPAVRPTFGASDSDAFMRDLAGGVTSAQDLLALPREEQPGLLAFLKPLELAKVLQTSGDSQLKMAVIDTLASVGSPAALDIIYRSLDDPDPQMQAKALEAADRLLGA